MAFFLAIRFFLPLKTTIQRYKCASCGAETPSPKRHLLALARSYSKKRIQRLIAFCRFKARLSNRLTVQLIGFFYGVNLSLGYVCSITYTISLRARKILNKLSNCRQKIALVMMGDETFPKIITKGKASCKAMAVVICEHGLIRAVKAVAKNGRNIGKIFADACGTHFNPRYFLSDYDRKYPKVVAAILENAVQIKDIVHTLRIIHRYFEQAIREVKIDYPKGLPIKERKKQKQLKKRLIRKRLLPIKLLFFKAFRSGYESVAHLYIAGALSELETFENPSIVALQKKLSRFFSKYFSVLLYQLEHKDGLVNTTNALESKNSILKSFTKIAKSFQKPETAEAFLNGVALCENFSKKERGKNKGTSAIQRAEVNTDDLGANDFFSAVGLA